MRFATKNQVIHIDDEFPLNFIKYMSYDDEDECPVQITDDIRHGVMYLLSKLEPRKQEVIRMRFIERKTYEEIGEIISVSKDRVRQIIGNVRREIRTPWNWRFIQYGIIGYIEHTQKYNYDQGYKDGYESAKAENEKGVETVKLDSLLNKPITELNLSMRSYNGMVRKGCRLVADMVKLTTEDIENIRTFGRKSAIETANKLKLFGITGTAWDKYL